MSLQDSSYQLFSALEGRASVEVIEAMLRDNPAGVSTPNSEGMLPLHAAARYNASVEVVQALLRAYPSAAHVADRDGSLPLHEAAHSNANTATVEAIIRANPNAAGQPNKRGMMPLHKAAQWKASAEVTRILVHAHRTAANSADNYGLLPFRRVSQRFAQDGSLSVQAITKAYPEAANARDHNNLTPYDLGASCRAKWGKDIAMLIGLNISDELDKIKSQLHNAEARTKAAEQTAQQMHEQARAAEARAVGAEREAERLRELFRRSGGDHQKAADLMPSMPGMVAYNAIPKPGTEPRVGDSAHGPPKRFRRDEKDTGSQALSSQPQSQEGVQPTQDDQQEMIPVGGNNCCKWPNMKN